MWQDILERQRRAGFAGFAGASVKGRVPIREPLINEAAQEAVRGKGGGAFTLQRIAVRDNNLLIVSGTLKVLLFSTPLNIQVAIEPIVDFPRAPYLKAQISGLIGTAIELFQDSLGLPPGIVRIAARTLTVDLKAALEAAGLPDFVPFVQYIGITTEPGVLYADFRLSVPPAPAPVRLPAETP